MSLDADGVDRRRRPPHSFEQVQQRNAARFVFRRVELDIVFVDDEPRFRVCLACRMIGEVEIFRPKSLEKYLRAQTVRPPVPWFDRLVDDIPAVDPAAISASQLPDMVDDGPFLLLPVG